MPENKKFSCLESRFTKLLEIYRTVGKFGGQKFGELIVLAVETIKIWRNLKFDECMLTYFRDLQIFEDAYRSKHGIDFKIGDF